MYIYSIFTKTSIVYNIHAIDRISPTKAITISAPTSDEVADPNDVRGLFHALTEGGCGGLMGPTEKKSQEIRPLKFRG